MSGAVLWVVAGDQEKPTSAVAVPDEAPVPVLEESPAPPPPPPRHPATSRRVPPRVTTPAALERVTATAVPLVVERPSVTARMSGAPLPRHRVRSTFLLVLLVVIIGLLVAVVIGTIVVALAFALRAAVTS